MASVDDLLAISDEKIRSLTARATDTEPDQATQLAKVDELYRSQGVALILGAGLSAAAGLPDWRLLMSKLSVASLATSLAVERSHAEALAEAYNVALPESLLIRARYLRDEFESASGSKEEFINAVRVELYRSALPVRDVPLMMSLARLCNRGQATSGGVLEIVTYNFDQLFEAALDELGCPYVAGGRGAISSRAELPVRHVHGCLTPPGRTASGEWLVFAEDEYHAQYSDPFSWPTIVQLNTFSERRCLFVGVSLDDPYTRRLLEAIHRQAAPGVPRHYAFMRCMAPAELARRLPVGWMQEGQTQSTLARVEQRLRLLTELADLSKERALRSLGIEVVWYKEYAELPGLIDRIGSRS